MSVWIISAFYQSHGYSPYFGSLLKSYNEIGKGWIAFGLLLLIYLGYLYVKSEGFRRKEFSQTSTPLGVFGIFMIAFILVGIERTLDATALSVPLSAAFGTIPAKLIFYGSFLLLMTTAWYSLGSFVQQWVESRNLKSALSVEHTELDTKNTLTRIFIGIAVYMFPFIALGLFG
ncbi:MAG: manganese efflux pump [Patescibacteria group bacterium]|nr:manganese efflux pump [Patescibacteria group bacterium]